MITVWIFNIYYIKAIVNANKYWIRSKNSISRYKLFWPDTGKSHYALNDYIQTLYKLVACIYTIKSIIYYAIIRNWTLG